MNQGQANKAFAELERLERVVGRTFGEETSPINSADTCEKIIKPGHKIPGPGCELSFVRKAVAAWRATLKPIRELGCCCCGCTTRGRQWWNRDTGYGICDGCIDFVRRHGETEAEIRDNYGVQGVHWGVTNG